MVHCWPTINSCAWTVSETEKRFSEGGYGRRDYHLEPLIFLIFPEVSSLRLRGHVRCLIITAILLMKYYRYFILFHVVTIWCFLSCGRLLYSPDRGVTTSRMCSMYCTCENRRCLEESNAY